MKKMLPGLLGSVLSEQFVLLQIFLRECLLFFNLKYLSCQKHHN